VHNRNNRKHTEIIREDKNKYIKIIKENKYKKKDKNI